MGAEWKTGRGSGTEASVWLCPQAWHPTWGSLPKPVGEEQSSLSLEMTSLGGSWDLGLV